MKKRIIFCFLFLVFIMANGNAQERRPVAVSPGSESGVVVVGQRCPTFSWSEVQWTEAYRIVVFQADGDEALPYEEMEALANPVISKKIRGPALSWTPSEEEHLSNGGFYVWYVQAVDASGVGVWSKGRMFRVEESVRLLGVEERLKESLSEYGMSDEDIDRVLNDVTSGVKEVDVRGSFQINPPIAIQGLEDPTNTAYGYNAGFSLTTGNYNSFFGANAGHANTTGSRNTFLGHFAGFRNTTGNYNTFLGTLAGCENAKASFNTFLGFRAGFRNTTGSRNTFLGMDAGYTNTTGNYNTFLGYGAGDENTTGFHNTFLGFAAGSTNTTGKNNTFLGYAAGYKNTIGNSNTFLGMNAGYYNTAGLSNTFLGYAAGVRNTTGNYNTFMGYQSGWSNTEGLSNTFLGYQAGYTNTTGDENTSLGYKAGFSNTTGFCNTFLGNRAGHYNTEGLFNTFVGYVAGDKNTTGDGNTFIGVSAGYEHSVSCGNTFLGYGAGHETLGSQNVFLGHSAGYNETGSHKLYIDSSDTSTPLIYGQFDMDKVTINSYLGVGMIPTNRIDVVGGAYCDGTNWVNVSSREYKENIESLDAEEAIDTLRGLEPVKFNYKKDKGEEHVGFIAEDVPDLVATKDRKGMIAMDVVAVLTKVVQEQQKTIGELQKEIDELKKKK